MASEGGVDAAGGRVQVFAEEDERQATPRAVWARRLPAYEVRSIKNASATKTQSNQ
jgi:hypothetical protein